MRLIDGILSRGNMLETLKDVNQNKGEAGVDKIPVCSELSVITNGTCNTKQDPPQTGRSIVILSQ